MQTISQVAVGAKVTAYGQNQVITGVNNSGSLIVIPTSVAGTGVTLATTGKVSFTTATTVSVNGCFTSAYDNYLLVLDISATSTSSGGGIRMRLAGTDNSTAASYLGRQSFGTASTFASAAYATTSFPFASTAATEHFVTATFNAPAIARPTRLQLTASAFAGTTATADTYINGKHNVSTAYDGFSVIPSTGNITGTLTVYGLNPGA